MMGKQCQNLARSIAISGDKQSIESQTIVSGDKNEKAGVGDQLRQTNDGMVSGGDLFSNNNDDKRTQQ